MRRFTTAALVAVTVLSVSAPAQADARVKDGNVGLSVRGKGLKVTRAGGYMDDHGTGVRARLYTLYNGQRVNVTRWKDATPVSAGTTKFSDVDWRLNRKFRNGSLLCIEFNRSSGSPCATIHR